jgi:hypothetical protein
VGVTALTGAGTEIENVSQVFLPNGRLAALLAPICADARSSMRPVWKP